MRVRRAMTRDVCCCKVDESLVAVGEAMRAVGCGVVPVCDPAERLVGVVTDRDICLHLTAHDVPASSVAVRDVMHRDVVTCRPDESLEGALALMRRHRVRRLPVLDGEGHVLGMLSLDDVAAEAQPASDAGGAPAECDVARTLRAVGHPQPYRHPTR